MPSLARHAAFLQVRTDYGPDSVDHSKSKHFTSQHAAEAEGQLNVSAWPRSKESLFANGDTNERYLVSSTDLMYELPRAAARCRCKQLVMRRAGTAMPPATCVHTTRCGHRAPSRTGCVSPP
jgi:hypothetical protein